MSIARTARLLEATTPVPFADALGARLESMIRTQMEAYPADWSDADKREMAEWHLFGSERA